MSIQEQNVIRKQVYREALRYMDNAKENLQKAKKQDRYYTDAKYVRTASAVAYSGMLLALDALFTIKGIYPNKRNRKSIEWYRDNLRKIDLKLLNEVNTAYDVLHLLGYYEGDKNVGVINAGMESALAVIKSINPAVN